MITENRNIPENDDQNLRFINHTIQHLDILDQRFVDVFNFSGLLQIAKSGSEKRNIRLKARWIVMAAVKPFSLFPKLKW